MSKLAEALSFNKTNQVRIPVPNPYIYSDLKADKIIHHGTYSYRFVLEATFMADQYISEDLADDPKIDIVALTRQNLKRKIQQEVFGEFIEDLHQAASLIVAGSPLDAVEQIHNIIKEMQAP